MKVKMTLWGLLFMHSIVYPLYADSNQSTFAVESDQPDLTLDKEGDQPSEEKEDASEEFIKLNGELSVAPSWVIQHREGNHQLKNDIESLLKLKAKVPSGWLNQEAKVDIGVKLKRDKVVPSKITVTFSDRVTVGYNNTILGYEKSKAALISTAETMVLQLKFQQSFDWFQWGIALESPVELKVGLWDKNKAPSSDKEEFIHELDDPKDKQRAFKTQNNLPAVGLGVGCVMQNLHIGLSGLLRRTDYTHTIQNKQQTSPRHYHNTYGGYLGAEYKVIPDKLTITGEGFYVRGLGDYIGGLSAMQKDEERKEITAVYYLDKDDPKSLASINTWGIGGSVKFSATPQWTYTVSAAYLAMAKDAQKPDSTFQTKWNFSPKIAYAPNKHLTLSLGYGYAKEYLKAKDQPVEHKIGSSIKLTF